MKRILINLTAVVLLPLLVAASCGTSKKTTPAIETSEVTEGAPVVYFARNSEGVRPVTFLKIRLK